MMTDNKNYTSETLDPQLQQMADEVKQAYEQTKQEEKSPSVDEAWKQFNDKYHVKEDPVAPSLTPRRNFWKRYGVAACLLLACMVAVAITIVRSEKLGVWSVEVDASLSEELGERSEEYMDEEIEENETSIIYRNVALSQIVDQLALTHHVSVNYLASADIRLYVELDRSWTLQESIEFLNHFEHVNLELTSDQTIEVR